MLLYHQDFKSSSLFLWSHGYLYMLCYEGNLSASEALTAEDFQCFSSYWKYYLVLTDIFLYFSGLLLRTCIFLSCSLLGQICSLIKRTAVPRFMAKLRNPGVLILTSFWLTGGTGNDHLKAQGVWFPGRSKVTSILNKPARMVVSICLAMEFLREGSSGCGCTGLPGAYQDVSGMAWPIGCDQFTAICLISYYLVSMCCFSCLLK